MNFRIKLVVFSFSLMFFSTVSAQDSTTVETKSYYNRKGMITIGPYFVNPNKESFVNRAYRIENGTAVSASGYVAPHVILGGRFSQFKGTVTDRTFVGDYDRTRFIQTGVLLGYHFFEEKRFQIILQGGLGWVTYSNIKSDARDFRDSGASYYLTPQLSFSIFKWLAVYGNIDFRFDKLKIKTSPEIENAFDHVNYLNFSTGIRLKI